MFSCSPTAFGVGFLIFFCGVEVLKSVGDIEERNIDRFVGNRSLEYAEVLLTHSLNWLFEEKHDYSSLLI